MKTTVDMKGSVPSTTRVTSTFDQLTLLQRLKYFFNPFDARFEDLTKGNWMLNAWRDTSAGLIVAMMAIPMAMGFAMASGLRPEHGILAGAIAGLVGALFTGSKYNVYGPVAALIPVIAGIMTTYRTPDDPYAGHSYLVLVCMMSAPILMLCGWFGWGRIANLVPHSIVVGFSVGIAITIALTQLGEVLGLKATLNGSFFEKMGIIGANLHQFNWAALLLGALTFLMTRYLLKISLYMPAPLIALAVCTLLSTTVLSSKGLTTISAKYGQIPTDFFVLTPPALPAMNVAVLGDLLYYALAFAFVCGLESILAARMADRMANNQGTPFNPNKEFFGQGLLQFFVPLLNGMPMSGALARTATNVKLGAVSPLSGIMKCVLKLTLAYFLARYLEMVPMACIGGILLWVAFNMIKPAEIKEVMAINRFHTGLMIYTALMVIVAGFLPAVLSAVVIYATLYRFFDKPVPSVDELEIKEAYAPSGD
ncbi:MAG TPA: SulP family inorganic anion transporter [Blastocatellia bacterium]|nr:SulP family inorganic anion transporter [Blastocatellia bacterium]